MTALHKQAVEILRDVPDDKMIYVIDILNWMKALFNNQSESLDGKQAFAAGASPDAFEAWEGFKKYKGIIQYNIDEKVELASARDEKYADFN